MLDAEVTIYFGRMFESVNVACHMWLFGLIISGFPGFGFVWMEVSCYFHWWKPTISFCHPWSSFRNYKTVFESWRTSNNRMLWWRWFSTILSFMIPDVLHAFISFTFLLSNFRSSQDKFHVLKRRHIYFSIVAVLCLFVIVRTS